MAITADICGRSLLVIASWATQSLGLADRVSAASYFCTPAPIEIGSYRPDDSDDELSITVRFPDGSPFWFDDQTGDFLAFSDGEIGRLQPARVHLPPELVPGADELSNLVGGTFLAGQCVASGMGVVPPGQEGRP